MRRTPLFLAVGGIAIAALFFSLARGQEARVKGGDAPRAWEYRVLALTAEQALEDPTGVTAAIEARFNELGRDGWELSTSLPKAVVFKRPKR